MTSQKTEIDWLRVRAQARPDAFLAATTPLFGVLASAFSARPCRGKDGFAQGWELLGGGVLLGRLDFGGDHMRGWSRLNLTGQGCKFVTSWDDLASIEALPAAELRRVDVCLTTWRGEVSHESVLEAHAAGRFSCGGRPPNLKQITHSEASRGRTCYIGERDSDKMLRAYEKGRQVAGQYPSTTLTHIDGCPVDDIYRLEVENKAATRPLPWDLIDRRDQYFAGAYPYLADVLPGIDSEILVGRRLRPGMHELGAALAHIRTQYGSALFTALTVAHGDIGAVWERIVGEHHHPSLVDAGALLLEDLPSVA